MHFRVNRLDEVFPLAEFVADAFGPLAEIVVHDISRPEHSIVFIRNGQLSGRAKGDGVTVETLKLASQARDTDLDFVSDYPGVELNDHQFRVSAYFLRNHQEKLIGLFCVNVNITDLGMAAKVLQTFIETKVEDLPSPGLVKKPVTENSEDLIRRKVRQAVKTVGTPVDDLDIGQRLIVIQKAKEQGIFMIKGAVRVVASELDISAPTLYRYLQRLR